MGDPHIPDAEEIYWLIEDCSKSRAISIIEWYGEMQVVKDKGRNNG